MQSFKDIVKYCNENPDNRYILDARSCAYYEGQALDGTVYGPRNCIYTYSWFAIAPITLEGNRNYLSDTPDGFYYIVFSEGETYDDELSNPTVLHFADISNSTPQVVDSLTVSHGGTYSIVYFDGNINLKY